MKVSHEWLKEIYGDTLPPASEIEDLLTFHSFEIEGVEKVGNHEVIDVDILPNRSSDCLCHRGIAREIATLTGDSLKNDPLASSVDLTPVTDKVTVSIEDTTACRRFCAALLTNIKVGESPKWLRERLEAVGQRSINNVVDATNYVMLSLGQPLHAYDAETFPHQDTWKFVVRFAQEGEKVVALSDEEYALDPRVQLIVEGEGDTAVGIAGIKGGKKAEVTSGTTTIILEAANFDGAVTRKASQALRLPTDASKRFENEVPREVTPYALKEVVRILEDIAGATCEGYVDTYPNKAIATPVQVTLSKINALLGLALSENDVEPVLLRLGFHFEAVSGGWNVTSGFDRTDITIEEDVIEEVGRVYGYDHVVSRIPDQMPLIEINARQYYTEKLRTTLIEHGYSEVVTSSFQKKDAIELQNALASDKRFLRSSLVKNITEALDKNIANIELLGLDVVRVFEIGTVFTKGDHAIGEHVSLALGVRTKKQGYNPKDDTALEETLALLQELLGVDIPVHKDKGVIECNITELLAVLPAPNQYDPFVQSEDVQFKSFSSFPFIARDIALWVEEDVTAEVVETALSEASGDLCVRTTLFDEFKKDGKISYAFRLVFQSHLKTLTDAEVNKIMDGVTALVGRKGWEVR